MNGSFLLDLGNGDVPAGAWPAICGNAYDNCFFSAITTYTKFIAGSPPCTGVYPAWYQLIITGSLGAYVWSIYIRMTRDGLSAPCPDCLGPRVYQGTSSTCTPPTLTITSFGAWAANGPTLMVLT